LAPIDSSWRIGNYRAQGNLKTDYLIFDYQPLRNFQANFEVSELGINPLNAAWGNSSQLSGSFTFSESPSVDATFLVNQFDLKELKFLGLHPMPVFFEGTLDAKAKMIGAIEKPDVSGRLTVNNGKIGEFKYEEAIVEFYGQPPHLKLIDSKITRKDKSFIIQGDLDFELENIFQRVKIVSLDQLVVWKGLDITSEIEKKAQSRQGDPYQIDALVPINAASSGPKKRKVEAEYALNEGQSFKVTAEDDEDSGHQVVTVGPKVKF
jgi:hypothetical protein